MLLSELHGYKQYQDKKFKDIIWNIVRSNNAKFDTGAFGLVIVPGDKNYVYKVWVKDSGYDEFYNLAMQHQDNPFFPKFIGKKRTLPAFFQRTKDVDLNVIKVEKLVDIPYADKNNFWTTIFKFARSFDSNRELTRDWVEKFVKTSLADDQSHDEYMDYIYDEFSKNKINRERFHKEYGAEMKKFRNAVVHLKTQQKYIPQAFEAMNLLIDKKLDKNFRLDLHDGNFMMRPNGEIVVTDPFVDENELAETGDGTMLDVFFNVANKDDALIGRKKKTDATE